MMLQTPKSEPFFKRFPWLGGGWASSSSQGHVKSGKELEVTLSGLELNTKRKENHREPMHFRFNKDLYWVISKPETNACWCIAYESFTDKLMMKHCYFWCIYTYHSITYSKPNGPNSVTRSLLEIYFNLFNCGISSSSLKDFDICSLDEM